MRAPRPSTEISDALLPRFNGLLRGFDHYLTPDDRPQSVDAKGERARRSGARTRQPPGRGRTRARPRSRQRPGPCRMIGLAARPETEVEPTCSRSRTLSSRALVMRSCSRSKRAGQAGSEGTSVIGALCGVSRPTVAARICSSVGLSSPPSSIACFDRLDRGSDGEGEGERAPRARLALHPQPPAVQLDEPPRQGQAQAGALPALATIGPPRLLELLEDEVLVLRGDP